jgi:hypothetical protein
MVPLEVDMKARLAAAVLASAIVGPAWVMSDPARQAPVTVHEWGTFTAIAGQDGRPVQWLPLSGSDDLPCFVHRARGIPPKSALWTTVRMETPVLYFYGATRSRLSVDVRFPLGLVTEYFPSAKTRGGSISWPDVRVVPGSNVALPIEEGSSHYYAARHADAAPVRVGAQTERFLFYRGAGSFPLPISAIGTADEDVKLENLGGEPLGFAIVFERRGELVGYRIVRQWSGSTVVQRPSPGGSLASLRADLERELAAQGLFPREAAAMVETWRDSWFEEGARVFYLIPQRSVDAILPLRITPAPSETVRVFVGRLELLTATTLRDVTAAAEADDLVALRKYDRFLMPIGERLAATGATAEVRRRVQSVIASLSAAPARCGT